MLTGLRTASRKLIAGSVQVLTVLSMVLPSSFASTSMTPLELDFELSSTALVDGEDDETVSPGVFPPNAGPSTASLSPLRFEASSAGSGLDGPLMDENNVLTLLVKAEPSVVSIGDVVSLEATVSNGGDSVLTDIVVSDFLEGGVSFEPTGSKEAEYDPVGRTVTLRISELDPKESATVHYALRITGSMGAGITRGEVWVHEVIATAPGTPSARASLSTWVGGPQENAGLSLGHIASGGGWAQVGRESFYIPAGTFAGDAAVILTPVKITGGPPRQFDIGFVSLGSPSFEPGSPTEARMAVENNVEASLQSAGKLVLSFDGIADVKSIPAGKEPFVVTYDEEAEVWVKVPIQRVDYELNTVEVSAVHFSTWGLGLGDTLPQNGANVLLFDEPYTSLFTGQSRFSFPVWVPPGRAGLAPTMSLSYASGTVNGVLGDVQAPWVGIGWSIDEIEIVRKITTDENGYGYSNDFVLTLNGIVYELVQDPTEPARYHTKDASFVYIERHNPSLGNYGDVASNQTHEWWEVISPDGTRYYLGRTNDSEQRALMDGYSCTSGNPCTTPNGAYASLGYAGEGVDFVALRWRVDRIIDSHRNFVEFSYAEEGEQPTFPDFDRASYLETIRYTGHADEDGDTDVEPAYNVRFVAGDRPGDNPASDLEIWDNYDTKLLDRIEICLGDCSTGLVVRQYDLGYEILPVPSLDGTLTLSSIGNSSPGFTDPMSGVEVPAASAADITFEYAPMKNWKESCAYCEKWPYPRLMSIHNGYGAQIDYTYGRDNRGSNYWYNWRVETAEASDGLSTASIDGFSYEDPVYEGVGGDPLAGALVGYTYVNDSTLDFNGSTVLAVQRHNFGTADPDVGRNYFTEWKDPAGAVLRKAARSWVTDNSGLPSGVTFRYLGYEYTYDRSDGSLQLSSKVRYIRDPSTGNLVEQREYVGSTLLRRINHYYWMNEDPDVWILDRVSRTTTADRFDQLLSDTRYVYDLGLGGLIRGDLGFVQSAIDGSGATSDIRYQYDEYGNITEKCAYVDYGGFGTAREGACSGTGQPTLTTFDVDLHTYPALTTNAAGDQMGFGYIKGLGVLWRVEDPDGFVSKRAYDGLGRVVSRTAPGFVDPTTLYSYPVPVSGQVAAPHDIELQIWDALGPGGGGYRPAWAIYDGLGRIRQSQVRDDDSDSLLLVDLSFNAQGVPKFQGSPRTVGNSGGTYYPPVWGTFPYTQTTYDSLGRTLEIEEPGGISTVFSYDGLASQTIDPNGHRLDQVSDGMGRLASVHEFTGVDPDWQLYATTTYKYDALDRLVSTIDAHGNQANVAYDWLGRRTSVDDPDLGSWSYEYDALGNLAQQIDARGQVLSFEYDVLNRLVVKHDDTAEADLATYTYGDTQGEIGMRTAMTDSLGTTTWAYADYARTVTEEVDLAGVVDDYTFTTESDYLGRVASIEYPDDETVTYSYDSLGRPSDLEGSSVGSLIELAYNTRSQIETASLGNGLVVQNCYDLETTRLLARRAYPGSAQSCAVANPADAPLNFTYAYDDGGDITGLQDLVRGESFAFEYDDLDRLTEAEGLGQTEIAYRERYSYDEIGRILEVDEWAAGRAQPGYYEESYHGFWIDGGWEIQTEAGASGGTIIASSTTGASIRLAFHGAGINYIRPIGPDQGIAAVYIDGSLVSEVDNYASTTSQQQAVAFSLGESDHLLEIRVTGEKNAQSSGEEVAVDAIEVLSAAPTPTPSSTPTATPVPTETPTPTITTVPTNTPTPTATPVYVTIAEVGIVTDLTSGVKTINLSRVFDHPIVIAQPLSLNGGDESVVRLRDIQSDRFSLFVDEAPNYSGSHSNEETVAYLVIEEGAWRLSDGRLIQAGLMSTDATVGKLIENAWESISFHYGFASTPVVVAQVQTENDGSWVKTRIQGAGASGFQVALEEEENSTSPHGTEDVGWVAVESGIGEWDGHAMEAETSGESVTSSWFTQSFTAGFSSAPRVLGGMATYNDDDNAELRFQSLTSSSIQFSVEEDITYDGEKNHGAERVGYLAIEGTGELLAAAYPLPQGPEDTPTPTPTLQVAAPGTYEENSTIFSYAGDWEVHNDGNYSAGKARIADSLGEQVSFRFFNTSFTYYRYLGPNRGIVEICIDGQAPEQCQDRDNYAATAAWIQAVQIDVPYGDHVATLRYSGRKNPDSTGYLVSLDKLMITSASPTATGTVTPTPTATASPTPTFDPTNPGDGVGLTGSYYDNKDLTGYVLSRTDATVQFGWGSGSPDPSIGSDTFSVRWSGWVKPDYTQTYSFYTNTDDGARLWVNGQQLVNKWVNQGTTEWSGTIPLSAGQLYPIVFEYFENAGGATAELRWSSPSRPKQIIPQGKLYPGSLPTPTPPTWPTAIPQTPQPPGTYENTSSAWYYDGAWSLVSTSGDSGGSRHEARDTYAVAQITFDGNRFDLFYRAAPYYGLAEVIVDGAKRASIDQYYSSELASQSVQFTLDSGTHVIELRRAGRKNAESSGDVVNIDKVVTYSMGTPTPTASPSPTSSPQPGATPSPTPDYRRIEVGSQIYSFTGSGYNKSFSYTVEDGEDRALVLALSYGAHSGQSPITPEYDDVPMTFVRSCWATGDLAAVMYYLPDPPIGMHTMTYGFNISARHVIGVVTLYNVDLLDPIENTVCQTGLGSKSATLDAGPGDLGVDLLQQEWSNPIAEGGGQTEYWNLQAGASGWDMRSATSSKPATGSDITMSYTTQNKWSGYIVAVFNALQGEHPSATVTTSPTPGASGTPEPGWEAAYYSYESAHPHAVVAVAQATATDVFGYDDVGSMTSRQEAGVSWVQPFNAEGRLASVTNSGTGAAWAFGYNGDGVRVRQDNPDGTATLFLAGGSYEVVLDDQGQEISVRHYYALGGQRVMREGASIDFLLTDHLGSIVGVTDNGGAVLSEQRYLPFGAARLSPGIGETDFGFTGQRGLASVGLLDYNARWYNSTVGRFVQADTLGDATVNPQALDRYAYVVNNPMVFTDPSGHKACSDFDGNGNCIVDESWVAKKSIILEPWKNDPGYVSDTDGGKIDDWAADNGLDITRRNDRAEKVYRWLCQTDGWWEGRCPTELELSAWLLSAEGSTLLEDRAFDIMARAIRYRLRGGPTKEALGGFTSFFNPARGDNGVLNSRDWSKLMRAPEQRYTAKMEEVYRMQGDYIERADNDAPVIHWWEDTDVVSWTLYLQTAKINRLVPYEIVPFYLGY